MTFTARFDGLPVFSRRMSTVVEYVTSWRPTVRDGWVPDPFRALVFTHPEHRVVVDARGATRVIVASLSRGSDARRLRTVFDPIVGRAPDQVRVAPLSLRVPVRVVDPAILPSEPRRLLRIDPPSNAPPRLTTLEGRHIELRINVTTGIGACAAFGEAVLGWSHVTRDGVPRSLFYPRDAFRSPWWTSTHDIARHVGGALGSLIDFVGTHPALELDRRDVTDLRVAVARSIASVDDVAFDVRLPTGGQPLEFMAVPWAPWYALATAGAAPKLPEPPR